MRSAFGFGGQKCSACSRVYVERPVYDEFVDQLVEKTEAIAVGEPARARASAWARSSTTRRSRRFERGGRRRRARTATVAGRRGARSPRATWPAATSCSRRSSTAAARQPGLEATSCSCRSSPSAPVDSLDEALELANDTEYGLTAGFFCEDPAEVERFLERSRPASLREPAGRRHHGRVAGRAAVRRLEGLGHDRQGRRRPATTCSSTCGSRATSSRTVIARSERADPRRRPRPGAPARPRSRETAPSSSPSSRARRRSAVIERDGAVTSAVAARGRTRSCPARGAGSMVEDVDGNVFLDFNAGIAVCSTGHCASRGGRGDPAPGRRSCSTTRRRDFYLPDLLGGLRAARRDRAGRRADAVVPHQLRDRGGRGGDQARAAHDRAAVRGRVPRRVPRALVRQRLADRVEVEVPRGVRAAAAGRAPRAVCERVRPYKVGADASSWTGSTTSATWCSRG